MKKLLSILLMAPGFLLASHSINLGGFYAVHSEPGYRYNLGGPTISYEIGNSKGLKAIGKVLVSSNSDLLYVQSRNEFRWYIKVDNFEVFPLWGVHHLHHQVVKREEYIGSLNRTNAPIGFGFKHSFENLSYEVSAAHLHPLSASFLYDEHSEHFYGRKLYMPHCFFIDSKVIYAAKPNLYANLGMTYTGDYRQKLRTFVVELSAIFGF